MELSTVYILLSIWLATTAATAVVVLITGKRRDEDETGVLVFLSPFVLASVIICAAVILLVETVKYIFGTNKIIKQNGK